MVEEEVGVVEVEVVQEVGVATLILGQPSGVLY